MKHVIMDLNLPKGNHVGCHVGGIYFYPPKTPRYSTRGGIFQRTPHLRRRRKERTFMLATTQCPKKEN